MMSDVNNSGRYVIVFYYLDNFTVNLQLLKTKNVY